MCNPTHSESGQLCSIDGCESYKLAQSALTAAQLRYGDLELETARIQSDRDRLAGVVAGMEEQGKRNLDALRREADRLERDFNAAAICAEKLTVKHDTLKAENVRLRESLDEVSKLVSASKDQSADHTKALFHIGRLADNALKASLVGTVYNGTDATLPPKLSWLCIHNNEYGIRMVAKHLHGGGGKCRDEGRHIYQLQIGDRWTLWPTMGGGK